MDKNEVQHYIKNSKNFFTQQSQTAMSNIQTKLTENENNLENVAHNNKVNQYKETQG